MSIPARPSDTGDDKILTVTKTGQPVKERVATVGAARALYNRMAQSMQGAAIRRARLKGMIDGNPPYNPARLEELGVGYMTNVNFGEAGAILDQKASSFFELFFEVPTLIQAQIQAPVGAMPPGVDYGVIIAEEFTTMLLDWPGFQVNMDKARRQSDAYGLGLMFWRDEYDWRPRAFNCGSFIPDALASLDIDNLQVFFLRDKFFVSELYSWALENEKLATEEGWAPDAVKRVLVQKFVEEMGSSGSASDITQTSDWESWQQRIRNSDPMVQPVEFQGVEVVHMVVRESDTGEISHYIFAGNQSPNEDTFLFRMPRRFKKMSQVLWWLPYNNGDDYLKSLRGLASKIEHYCDLSDRFLGRVFDAGFITASLLLQPATPGDLSQLSIIREGAITVVPNGTNVIQSSFQPQIAPLVSLRDVSASVMRNNTGVWKAHPEILSSDIQQQPKTARQVAEEASKEARMEKASVVYDYYHIERLYREMYRRATNPTYLMSKAPYPGKEEALAFVARCVARGVPEALLFTPGVVKVKVTRAIGLGSWSAKLDIAQQILSNRGLLDEEGQVNAIRDWLAVLVSYQNVDRYKATVDRDQIPTNVQSMVALENNDIAEGHPVVVGGDQVHAIHIKGHIEPLVSIVQLVLQTQGEGMDVDRSLAVLKQGGAHILGHLQYLAQDPAREPLVKTVQKFLENVSAAIKFLERQQERQALAQGKAQDAMNSKLVEAEQAIQDRDFLLKMRESDQKQQSMHAQRMAKTQAQVDLQKEKMQSDLSLEAQKQTADIQMRAEAAKAKIAIDQAKQGA